MKAASEKNPAQANGVITPNRIVRWTILAPISLLYQVMLGLASVLSAASTTRMTYFLLWPLLRLLRHQRVTNIQKLFGPKGWTKAQIEDLDRSFVKYHARLVADSLQLLKMTPEELQQRVTLEGEEHLMHALKNGGGVLLIGTHIGNWVYSVAYLSTKGFLQSCVGFEIPIRSIEAHLKRIWRNYNVPIIRAGSGGRDAALRTFERNGICMLMYDVCLRPLQGKWFGLGGAMINADMGPAALAVSSGPNVLFLDNHRTAEGRHVLRISPALHPDPLNPEQLTVAWLGHFYSTLLLHPEQWWLLTLVPLQRAPVVHRKPAPREEEIEKLQIQ